MKTSHYHITATPHYYRKTFCSYSYILLVHFKAQHQQFEVTKIRVSWNGELPLRLHVPNYKMFLTPPKFE